MVAVQIQLQLPDSLADEAEANCLLTAEAIEELLRSEIRRRRISRLFDTADKLATLELPPLTAAELESEIQAARIERRGELSGRR